MGNKYRGVQDSAGIESSETTTDGRSAGADGSTQQRANAVVQEAVQEAAAETEAADDAPSDEEQLQSEFGDVGGFGGAKASSLAAAGYSSEDDVRRTRDEDLESVDNVGEETAARLSEEASANREHSPEPETDIPRFKDDEMVGELIEETNEDDGGFTFHSDLSPQPPGSADEWMVGMTADVQEEKITKDDVVDVYEEYQEELRDYSGLRIGGYAHEDGGYAVEVTVALTDQDEAEQLGRDLDQETVFNINDFTMIETDGEGNSPIDSPKDLRGYLDNVDTLSEV